MTPSLKLLLNAGVSCLALLAASPSWAQQGDVVRGGELFATHCAECHSVKEGRNKKGPSLYNIAGTKAGLNADYQYSDAMKNSHITWDAESLSKYILAPKAFVPGGKMKYEGLDNATDRTHLIAYLAAQSKH